MSNHLKLIFATILISSTLSGQQFLAGLTGRVTDANGGPVPAAEVELSEVATGRISNTTTDENGFYQVLSLAPGEYKVIVQKTGFQRIVNNALELEVAQKAELNVTMTVGDLKQTVEVTADASVVQGDTADQGLSVDRARIESAPLQGRNIIAAAFSAPGVAVTSKVQRLRPFDTGGSSGMSINGGQPSMNEILIDGVSNINPSGLSIAYVPPVESTQEFRVQTTNFDAQYGWTTGGVINVVTRGGTNEFHGVLYEFLQNTHLNANSFLSNINGLPRNSTHINTFGGNIGGPIKKNKLFFFFSAEDLRQVIPDPFTTSVPTAAQRAGDFSSTYYGVSATGAPLLQTIYNPFSTRTDASGNIVRDAFPGNKIPASLLNPVALKVLSIIPLGNVPGNSVTGLNNLVNSGSTRKFTDFFPEYMGRVDYDYSQKTRILFRYGQNALSEARGFHYSTVSTLNPADTTTNAPFTRNNNSATVQLTHVINASTVLELRAGLLRFVSNNGSTLGANYDLASLGFSNQFVSQGSRFFPKFNWANYEGAGSQPPAINPASTTQSFQSSISKTVGRQTIKLGGEYRLERVNTGNPGYSAGNFSFTQQFTGASAVAVLPDSGNAIASFLLGTPQTGFIDNSSQPARQQNLFSVFVQDDVRLSQRLTLNLGLRWDYLGAMTDRYNALTRGFDTTTASPLQVPGLNLKGGLLYVNPNRRGAYDQNFKNFGPRIGLAYRLNDKTVIRGGYGLFYANIWNDPGNAPGFSQQTSMVSSIVSGVPLNTLTNPFPTALPATVGTGNGLATNLGQTFNIADPSGNLPYFQQYSVQIQRELPYKLLLNVGYAGSHGSRIDVTQAINEISAANLALGSAALTRSVPNPLAGSVPGTSLNGATVQAQQLLRPFPQFLSINETARPFGTSRYDGIQALLSKRMSRDLSVSFAYTFSKTFSNTSYLNAQNSTLAKSIASWDVPQSFQINGTYDIPSAKARFFGTSGNSVTRYVTAGWQVGVLARFQSGQPMAMPANVTPTGLSPVYANQNLNRWFDTCTVLASGATQNCLAGEQPVWRSKTAYNLQTGSPYLTSVRLPGIRNVDISITKSNRITERISLLFRADLINSTNTAQFLNGPITDANNANFGRIAGTADQSNLPRFVQLSLKLVF